MEDTRTRLQKAVLIAIAVMVVVFGNLTLVSKLHKGVLFADTILKVEETSGGTVYSGKVYGDEVSVSVKRESGTACTVTYTVDERIHDVYRMEYPLAPVQTEDGPVDGIRITRNGDVLYEGGYAPDRAFSGWYGADGRWDTGVYVTVVTGGESVGAAAPAELSKNTVFSFAQGPELTARGSWALYFLMVFFTGLLALDAAFPLTMFRLQHMCDVRDPEPSDFYLSMQRVAWVVYPVLLFIGYIWALRFLP